MKCLRENSGVGQVRAWDILTRALEGVRELVEGKETAGPSTSLRFGRDDNSVSVSKSRRQNQFVIPTGA